MAPKSSRISWRAYAALTAAQREPATMQSIRREFVASLGDDLLPALGVARESGRAIAECLFARMSDPRLFYHTPLHILSILSFAAEHGVSLAPWQRLAIWFHDAVYWPGADDGRNEQDSAALMRALLGGAVAGEALDQAADAILATALHAQADVDPRHDWILDLDICNFAWDRPSYDAASANVARELVPIHGAQAYERGRKQFLSELLGREFIYRTPLFRERLEAAARANLQRSL